MEEKLTSRLFFLGLFASLFSFVLAFFSFSSMSETNAREEAKSYADALRIIYENAGFLKMQGILKDGEYAIITDSDGKILKGDSPIERFSLSDEPILEDGYIVVSIKTGEEFLSLYTKYSGLFPIVSAMFAFAILIVASIFIISIILARGMTERMTGPLKTLASANSPDEKTVYPEILPYVRRILTQRFEINEQFDALSREKAKLTAVIYGMSEGLIIIDRNFTCLSQNDAAKAFLGADFTNNGFLIENDAINEAIKRAVNGIPSKMTIKLNKKSLRFFINPSFENGVSVGAICFILDVTDSESIDELRSEFSANVSHELKTPLTTISGYAELIESGIAKDDDALRFVGKISAEARRMQTLIGDIIKLSSLEHTEKLFLSPIDPIIVAEDCKRTLEEAAKKRNITITTEGDGEKIESYEPLLHEILYNLIDNAIRYNVEGGSVAVRSEKGVISVTDTGVGITNENIGRIFERFYRVDKSRSKSTGGTGLGLAIVKHSAKLLNMTINVKSELGVGTEISVSPY
ncbi:MAG: ATP-binding protein [Clostridia bacterium]